MPSSLVIGLEKIRREPKTLKDFGRIALLCNQASVSADYTHAAEIFSTLLTKQLTCFLSPQHGLFGVQQDNMIESEHGNFSHYNNLPIFSLYSDVREPTAEMLSHCDTIAIDLQNVGCRVYTFKYTVAACLRAAKKHHKKVLILDRPNPLGGVTLEGMVLEKEMTSFVGEFQIPMRHGLTLGEAALFFNSFIGADLEIIPMTGWNPEKIFSDLNSPWVMTSPNLPTIDPVYIYPGTVALEGTNISEGRGTALPFQLIGAPYIKDSYAFVDKIKRLLPDLRGVFLRPVEFMPTYHKGAHDVCRGVQIHILKPEQILSFTLGVAIIRTAMEMGGDLFAWKKPPYEYNFETLPIKLIYGCPEVAEKIQASDFSLKDSFWHSGIESYIEKITPFLLYPRQLKIGA